MTLQEQIEVVMENIDTPIANSGSLQIARQIIRKQSEMLKVAIEGVEEIKSMHEGLVCDLANVTIEWCEKALATIEELEKL